MPQDKRTPDSGARRLGRFGEDAACRWLKRRGYKILERNFACRYGEIDIIARTGDYVVFAEVKLRKDGDFVRAAEYVTPAKQRRVILAAETWLSRNRTALQPRFDVLEVYAPAGAATKRPEIYHIEDAYGL